MNPALTEVVLAAVVAVVVAVETGVSATIAKASVAEAPVRSYSWQ